MKNATQNSFRIGFGCLALGVLCILPVGAQDAPDVGPHPPAPRPKMESHIGNVSGHSDSSRAHYDYRRYCAGCHGDLGDGNGENALWIDPKPRDFSAAVFKCRSTPTGTLPTDEDLFNTIGRGLTNSNMPIWNTFDPQQKADLVAYIKTFSPRWEKEKAGQPIPIPPEPPITIESISHGKALFTKLECWKCHGPQGKGDGPSAATLTAIRLASSRALSARPSARLLNSEPKPLTMIVPAPCGRTQNASSALPVSCASDSAKPSRGSATL